MPTKVRLVKAVVFPVIMYGCETAKETQMYKTDFLTLWERERGRGWDDLGEWHSNMYTIMKELNRQSMSYAGYSMLGAGAWG